MKKNIALLTFFCLISIISYGNADDRNPNIMERIQVSEKKKSIQLEQHKETELKKVKNPHTIKKNNQNVEVIKKENKEKTIWKILKVVGIILFIVFIILIHIIVWLLKEKDKEEEESQMR